MGGSPAHAPHTLGHTTSTNGRKGLAVGDNEVAALIKRLSLHPADGDAHVTGASSGGSYGATPTPGNGGASGTGVTALPLSSGLGSGPGSGGGGSLARNRSSLSNVASLLTHGSGVEHGSSGRPGVLYNAGLGAAAAATAPAALGSGTAAGAPGTAFIRDGSGLPLHTVPSDISGVADVSMSTHSVPSTSTSSAIAGKTRILFSSGGNFERKDSKSAWEYLGGETRLLSVQKAAQFSHLLQQLAKTTSNVWDEAGRIMYQLPGSSSGVLVDVLDDDDVANMWEECEEFKRMNNASYKLHLYVQQHRDKNVSMGSSDWAHTPPLSADKAPAPAAGHAQPVEHSHESTRHDVLSEASGTGSDLISEAPKVDYLELEAKLEVMSPDQLEAVRLLGVGGYGEVYLAKWHSSEVAVKCLNPRLFLPDGGLGSATGDVVTKLLKEGSMLGSLRHPNVVWVYGIVLPQVPGLDKIRGQLQPGQSIDAVNLVQNPIDEPMVPGMIRPPALVTEYMTAGSVRNALARKADFMNNPVVRVKVALDTARGMEYLHSKKIVHFDLKTANLLIGFRDKTPICKVADFGLSKQRQATYVTGINSLRGTLPWTAPEVILTPKAVTEKVDVYSFAIVMWELWCGREPFQGMNFAALLHAMGSNACLRPLIPGCSEWEGEVPPEPCPGWSELMQSCWRQDPKERPTFSQLLADLELMFQTTRSLRRRGTA